MTLSKALRDQVRTKLDKITTQALGYRIRAKCRAEGIADPDVALLLIAFDSGIMVTKPRYSVPSEKLKDFQEYLKARKTAVIQPQTPVQFTKSKKGKKTQARVPTLLNFKGKNTTYPQFVFYNKLEDEINTAYGDERLPNAALVLSRKLIENLVFNLLQYRFVPKRMELYFDVVHSRAKDFSVLIENMSDQKSEFDADIRSQVDEF